MSKSYKDHRMYDAEEAVKKVHQYRKKTAHSGAKRKAVEKQKEHWVEKEVLAYR